MKTYTNYNYIASYIIFVEEEHVEILDCSNHQLTGGLNEACYFQECADSTDASSVVKLLDEISNGVWRIVVGAECFGSGPDESEDRIR